tara:strand:- start:1598 stop:1798 length:201 start_codon:yes stop_codon:yes gene_type:complete
MSAAYTPSDVGMIVAAVAAAVASILYSAKHVKKSRCCGMSCEQEVETDEDEEEERKKDEITIITNV